MSNEKKEKKEVTEDHEEGIDMTCYNCRHKTICRVVNDMWSKEFKGAIAHVAQPGRVQKFFEAVERILAKICDVFDPEI